MKVAVATAALLLPAAAWAQDEGPRFCPNRPSLESSACTTEPGRVHVEFSVADWTLDDDAGERNDTILGGDFLARLGVGSSTEVQLAWTPVAYARTRDKATGAVSRVARPGDARLAVRQNLANPDGSGLSYGLEPFVTLPVGRSPVGAGTWGAGVVLPVTYDVSDTVNVGFTGELDAAPDDDGRGRHLQYSGVAATSLQLTRALSLTVEGELLRDRDPTGHETQALAGLGMLWKYSRTRAFYAEAIGGLNGASPDVQLYAGVAALF
ncbi:transporter [Sphingomonas rubra]|uniref:Putative MetA-pathway of phenol degradation n=1 Tax=Sphingomonas rubra TaxID=634430 RepID=A0A1I5PKU3_9SPHN|nr:transporter [Sphingomonas rubra]SFP34738.1 Putative MetA-pathway of phenol degradation [Sphingomonas rubra]